MRFKLVIPALVAGFSLAAAFSTPASAQYVYGSGYYGPGPYGPAYAPRPLPYYYYGGPATGPLFYGDGWVPYPIYEHSRPGSVDPFVRPPGSYGHGTYETSAGRMRGPLSRSQTR